MESTSRELFAEGTSYMLICQGAVGSEQGGVQPVLVIQNDIGNQNSNTIIVAPITSKLKRLDMPTHTKLGRQFGLAEDSVVLLEQIRTIDRNRFTRYVGSVDQSTMIDVERAIFVSIGSCLKPIKRGEKSE